MKKTRKVFGIIALIAVIGFMTLPLTGCGDPKDETKTVVATVATPTANPGAGTYTAAQSVTLSTTTEGATIYYTTDGTDPTTSSTEYSSAISISATTTLKAFAVKDGMTDSDVLTAAYTINLPVSIPELTVGKWSDGNITTAGGEQWFKFTTAESQTSAYIHFMPTGTLNGAYVQLYANNQTTTVGDRATLSSGISSYFSRTVTAGTEYYIKVTPSSSTNNKGTYKIGVVSASLTIPSFTSLPTATTSAATLTANTWTADQTISAANTEQWFKFTSASSETSQYIFCEPGSLQSLYAQVYKSDGTSVGNNQTFTGTSLSASRTVTASTDYYIMVYSYSTGTYKIGVNSTSTPPPVTVPTSTATALIADTWVDGNITAAGGEQWFSLPATATSHYIHFLPETLTDVYVQLFDKDGKNVGNPTNLFASTISNSRTSLTNNADYYIRVSPYYTSSSGTGTYKIGFNTTAETPKVTPTPVPTTVSSTLTVDQFSDGNIANAGEDQWFKFTSTAATQYIHFDSSGTLSNVYVQLYTSDGRLLGGSSNFSSYNTYTSRTVTNGTVYYIKVTPSSSTGKGTYKIGFNTSSTKPNIKITLPTTGVTTLSAGTWGNGDIATAGGEQWFSFVATTTGNQYIHFLPGLKASGGLNDVYIQLYDDTGISVGSQSELYDTSGQAKNLYRSVTSGKTYYIKVWPYYSSAPTGLLADYSHIGTYKIAFNSSSTAPTVTP